MGWLNRRTDVVVELEAARNGHVSVQPSVSSSRRLLVAPPRQPSGRALEVAQVDWPGATTAGVSRDTALTIPAVCAARNLIVGTVTLLELLRYRGAERLDPGYLLSKPDPSTVWTQTIAGTVDDLLFQGVAYWRVLERDSEGLPTRARWTPVSDVAVNARSDGGSYVVLDPYTVAGVGSPVPVADLIRFDGVSPGLLTVGGPVLSAALELEAAARRLSSVELPAGVLKNEGTELGPDEAAEVLAAFQEARRTNGVAFLQGIGYTREMLNSDDLALVQARDRVDSDVARLTNVPVAMLSASPSGNSSALVYANISQNKATLMTAVAPHLRVIELTLSDVFPRGQSCAFDVQSYLRSDPQAASDYVTGLVAANIITVEEGRGMLGIPPTTSAPDLTPGRV